MLQSTPAFVASFVTTAVSAVLWLMGRYSGGGTAKDTDIAVAPVAIVVVASAVTECCAVEVAITVTKPLPEGMLGGAVKTVGEPLFVCVGLKEPQLDPLVQVADQSTPALEASLATVAVTFAVASTPIVVGGAAVMVTVTDRELEQAVSNNVGIRPIRTRVKGTFEIIPGTYLDASQ
jgi:hypothetical protein